MSCEHGNWAPCEACDKESELHARIEALEKERDSLRADKATLQQMTYSLKDRLEAAEKERDALLKPVIDWLRNGCDPMQAADELELLIAATPEAKP